VFFDKGTLVPLYSPSNSLSFFMDQTTAFQKILAFYETKKRMPSVREVRDLIIRNNSIRQAKALVDSLVEDGLILRDKRGLLQPTTHMLGIRELGVVEAGFPSNAEEEVADAITLDEWLIKDRGSTYMLKVSGESMRDAGIRPGDTALVERGRQPKNNDIVIACVDGKWTMKYYQKTGGVVVLVPANPKFPKIYPKEELHIEAVVTAIIRKY
jgi:SOS regulatory protein LexA